MTQPRALHRQTFGLLVAALLALGAPARAEDARAGAKAHYEKGSVLFDLQRYDDAAAEYEAAYELKPDAAFLFNLGQAYRLAKRPERAIRAYSAYLRRMTQAKNRAEVEARINEMKALDEQQRAEAEAAAKVEPTPAPAPIVAPAPAVVVIPPAPPPRRGPRPSTLKWTGLALGLGGLALTGIGGGLYGAGRAAFLELNQPGPGAVFDPAVERRMNTLRPTGVALLAIGLAATTGGFTLFGIQLKKERSLRDHAAAAPTITGSMEARR